MHRGKSFLAVIPARGGSKRLPRKNLLDLGGKPMIAWSIEAACACAFLDHVLVSTDDPEIAAVAREHGAHVPFLRPEPLATDTASTIDVVAHVIGALDRRLGLTFDFTVLLQPTSPLRRSADIAGAVELLGSSGGDAVISVCEAEHSPLWMNVLPADRSMSGFLRDDVRNLRSQDLPRYCRLNGAIYVCRTERLLAERTFLVSSGAYAYVMDRANSVDIDDPLDLDFARYLVSADSIGQCP